MIALGLPNFKLYRLCPIPKVRGLANLAAQPDVRRSSFNRLPSLLAIPLRALFGCIQATWLLHEQEYCELQNRKDQSQAISSPTPR